MGICDHNFDRKFFIQCHDGSVGEREGAGENTEIKHEGRVESKVQLQEAKKGDMMRVQTKTPEAGMAIEPTKPASPTHDCHSASSTLRGIRRTLR